MTVQMYAPMNTNSLQQQQSDQLNTNSTLQQQTGYPAQNPNRRYLPHPIFQLPNHPLPSVRMMMQQPLPLPQMMPKFHSAYLPNMNSYLPSMNTFHPAHHPAMNAYHPAMNVFHPAMNTNTFQSALNSFHQQVAPSFRYTSQQKTNLESAQESPADRKRRLAAARQRRYRERMSEADRMRRRKNDAESKRRRRLSRKLAQKQMGHVGNENDSSSESGFSNEDSESKTSSVMENKTDEKQTSLLKIHQNHLPLLPSLSNQVRFTSQFTNHSAAQSQIDEINTSTGWILLNQKSDVVRNESVHLLELSKVAAEALSEADEPTSFVS